MTTEQPAKWFETAFGAHYPLLYRHRNEAEAKRCLALLPTLAPLSADSGAPVLDLGCGDGRHLAWLKEMGIPAVGLDLSAHLLAAASARALGPTVPLVRGDMRCLPFVPDGFSSVLSLFTAFGYFGAPAANRDPVLAVAHVLQPGGHWFLDYLDGDVVRTELGDGQPRERRRQVGCLAIRETRRFVAATSQVVKDVVVLPCAGQEKQAALVGVRAGGLRYSEEVAVFTLAELDEMARSAGLRRVAGAGDYQGAPLGSGPRWILVYEKERVRH